MAKNYIPLQLAELCLCSKVAVLIVGVCVHLAASAPWVGASPGQQAIQVRQSLTEAQACAQWKIGAETETVVFAL